MTIALEFHFGVSTNIVGEQVANFYLIDHSLLDFGGHHADYVKCVAQAAERFGYQVTVGAHRKLPSSGRDALGLQGNISSVFRHTTYQSSSQLAGLRQMTRSKYPLASQPPAGMVAKTRHYWGRLLHWRQREQFISEFAEDCEHFFHRQPLNRGDHVFFATVSELELLGLAQFLCYLPRTQNAHWHLQFHFSLFSGRPPEYELQNDVLVGMRACFAEVLNSLPRHKVSLYTTSEELAEQYNRLEVKTFWPLAYPVAVEYRPDISATNEHQSANDGQAVDQPQALVRITCPGGIRREKGQASYLQSLVDQLGTPYIKESNLQFAIQRPRPQRFAKQKLTLAIPAGSVEQRQTIEYLPHPLSREQYVDLIKSTDIGLLHYDSHVYYSRRAGVLGELLACGKPVIVPAGCWLAEQIEKPTSQYADRLVKQHAVRVLETSELQWESHNVPGAGHVISFNQDHCPFVFRFRPQPDEQAVGLRFDWHWPREKGIYCRIDLAQFNSAGKKCSQTSRVVGQRIGKQAVAIFNIHAEATELKFTLANAFHRSMASIKNMQLVPLVVSERGSCRRPLPIGCVGAIASDQHHLGECVKEIVTHLSHYQTSAQQFSHHWYRQHDPQYTVQELVAGSLPARRVAS